MTKDEAMKLALEAAYLAGFNASGEGYNGEYPFRDHNAHPEQDAGWMRERDKHVEQALAEQPAQQEPVAKHYVDGGHLVYPPPQRTWVGLTDEQIWKFWWSRPEVPDGEDDSMEAEFVAAVRAVLAAHGIKENT